MQITDPIADMLTRIRNAGSAKHETVDVPASKMKKSIAEILLEEGYIKNYQIIDDGTQGIIRITLKYLPGKEKAIQGIRRVSKPGLRVYAGADELPRVLKGLGIAIVSMLPTPDSFTALSLSYCSHPNSQPSGISAKRTL